MQTNQVLGRNELFSSMEAGQPFKSYKKTILGRLAVDVWDNFTNTPTEIILHGDPKRNEEGCIVDVWSEKEDAFFTRINRNHFKKGRLIPYTRPIVQEADVVRPVEQSTDEELAEIANLRYLALLAKLNKIDSVAVLFRLRGIAEELDKSEKITNAIEARITELQNAEYEAKVEVAKEEE